MNFKQACKSLAEMEPGKFRCGEHIFEWTKNDKPDFFGIDDFLNHCRPEYPTQDDIDSILAEVGWEYSLDKCYGWHASIWRVGAKIVGEDGDYPGPHIVPVIITGAHPTKLEAAQAALIAVVEELERRKK